MHQDRIDFEDLSVIVASTSDGTSHRAENREDHADRQHDNADAPQDGELRNESGDNQQDNA
jgi:hypothetical protein